MISLIDINRIRRVLCVGAHSDDIEIGCGGTLLRMIAANHALEIRWVVFCGADEKRAREARQSAHKFLHGAAASDVRIENFRDAYMPYCGEQAKDAFEAIKKDFAPDVVFTHYRDDRHQDHRVLSDLAWNTWRDHLILEYEIFKYDGDLGRPNVFSPITRETCQHKIDLLMSGFPTQATKQWFTPDVFWAMLRLRGVEANSPTQFAEAFYCRKMLF